MRTVVQPRTCGVRNIHASLSADEIVRCVLPRMDSVWKVLLLGVLLQQSRVTIKSHTTVVVVVVVILSLTQL